MSSQQQQQQTVKPKVDKKNLTSYWGVELNVNDITQIEQIKQALYDKPQLKQLEKIHSTLLFVGKKEGNTNEDIFKPLEKKQCNVNISSFGLSDNALCVKVDSITYLENDEEKNMPTFATHQHITFALGNGTKAVDSVKALSDGQIINIDKKILSGTVKRYLF